MESIGQEVIVQKWNRRAMVRLRAAMAPASCIGTPSASSLRKKAGKGGKREGVIGECKVRTGGRKKVASIAGDGGLEDIEDSAGAASFGIAERENIRVLLLDWYDKNHRELPWRTNLFSKRRFVAGEGSQLAPPQEAMQENSNLCSSEDLDGDFKKYSFEGSSRGFNRGSTVARCGANTFFGMKNNNQKKNDPDRACHQGDLKFVDGFEKQRIFEEKLNIDLTTGDDQENSNACHNSVRDGRDGIEIELACVSERVADRMRSDDGVNGDIGLTENQESRVEKRDTLEEMDAEIKRRAYEVWVSEIMLQQTRVATVMEYYKRWISKWGSMEALAKASLEEVNEMWAGLGYYRRARFLLQGVKHVMEHRGGNFPSTVNDLMTIPGIGRYTAGAIASIAFGQVAPIVDGNVVRVVSRLRALEVDPKLASSGRMHWRLAEQLVDPKRPGDFNQALMEFGATLCTVSSPSCSSCPISQHCHARARVLSYADAATATPGTQLSGRTRKRVDQIHNVPSVTDFPAKSLKAAPREEHAAVCVVELLVGPHLDNTGVGTSRSQEEGQKCAIVGGPDRIVVTKRKRSATRARMGKVCNPDLEGPDKEVAVGSSITPSRMKSGELRQENERVELEVENEGGSLFLLVQRPEEGLLAGQWEFPSVPLPGPDVSVKRRREAMKRFLQKDVGLSFSNAERTGGEMYKVITREDVGSYCHVFSHIRLHMQVELLRLRRRMRGEGEDALLKEHREGRLRWETQSRVKAMGLTSGVRKVFNMVMAQR